MTVIVTPEAIPLPLLVNPCVFIHKLSIQNSLYPHCTVVPGQLTRYRPFLPHGGLFKKSAPQTIFVLSFNYIHMPHVPSLI